MNISVIVWLIAAVALGVLEAVTVALVSVWLAVGAVGAAIGAALGAGGYVQALIFLGVSAVLLVLTAPLSKKFRHQKKTATNADRFIGAEGMVTLRIDPVENKGQIKVMGQVWSAVEIDGGTVEAGERVVIEDIRGVHAVVRPLMRSLHQEAQPTDVR